jgi:drug/metabolite transporter (DMT)-like permease
MTELAISILASTLLFFIFRLFPKYGVDTAQAIIVNYFTAFICGCIVNGSVPSFGGFVESGILPWTLVTGILLISLFIGIGVSSYRNGIGITSVAVKMSLLLSVLFMLSVYGEKITPAKIAGIVLAIAGILLITLQKEPGGRRSVFLLAILFVGSSVLDLTLNYVQGNVLKGYPSALYTAFGFLAAGSFGTLWMISEYLAKRRSFNWKNVAGGIILGIPNYFSIYLLVDSYRSTGWSDSVTLAVTGISIVILSALSGIMVFRESASFRKLAGLFLSLSAIALLTLI